MIRIHIMYTPLKLQRYFIAQPFGWKKQISLIPFLIVSFTTIYAALNLRI